MTFGAALSAKIAHYAAHFLPSNANLGWGQLTVNSSPFAQSIRWGALRKEFHGMPEVFYTIHI